MLTNNDRKNFIGLLKEVERFSDKEYQKRVWIRAEGWEVDDFDEAICNFFSGMYVDNVIEKYREYELTENQRDILKKFRDELDEFAVNNHQAEEFIDTPWWQDVVDLAKEVLKAFNYKKGGE